MTVERTIDELDRVTLIEYPDSALDTEFEYDDAGVDFSKGRLTAILRHGQTHSMAYDRFGRVTRDGWQWYDLDENGNPLEITYGGASGLGVAVYTFDYADCPATLDLEVSTSTYPVVTAAVYEPFGPLTEWTYDNGVTEAHLYDDRYQPDRITVDDGSSTLVDWDYSIDEMGNVTAIADLLNSTNDQEFVYQDVQYFLECAAGPWKTGAGCDPASGQPLQWAYDKIGNRLSETREGSTISYTYASNGASGNTPLLTDVGSVGYDYDEAGNLIEIDPSSPLDLAYDDEGRLSEITRRSDTVDLSYDGRGFLQDSDRTIGFAQYAILPLYASSGRLMTLVRQFNPGGPIYNADWYDVLYFADRPVAVAVRDSFSLTSVDLHFYSTDHLGTPIHVTDDTATAFWKGGFEPFGEDYVGKATKSEVFLRLPGQFEEETWEDEGLEAGLYYNVNRWYQPTTGRYTRTDPFGVDGGGPNVYLYAQANPLRFFDPDGRKIVFEDFPTNQQQDAEQAVQQIKQQLQDTPCCVDGDRAEKIIGLIDDPNRTVKLKYRPNAKRCGFTPLSSMLGFNNTIRIGPGAWNCCQKGGPSGVTSLASTILHELHHFLFRTTERPAYEAEKKCFGCQAQGQ